MAALTTFSNLKSLEQYFIVFIQINQNSFKLYFIDPAWVCRIISGLLHSENIRCYFEESNFITTQMLAELVYKVFTHILTLSEFVIGSKLYLIIVLKFFNLTLKSPEDTFNITY